MTLPSLLGVALIALVHLFANRLRFMNDEGWHAISAGVALSYVFLDLLPHLAAKQQILLAGSEDGLFAFLTHHAYLLALAGMLTFIPLATAAQRHQELAPGTEAPRRVRTAVLAIFSGYNLLIGVLIGEQPVHRAEPVLLFALAIAIHVASVDAWMRTNNPRTYDRIFRFAFAAAVTAGYALAVESQVSMEIFSLAFSFVAGAIMTVAIAFELPPVLRAGASWRFVGGAVGFSALLLIYEALASPDLGA